MKSVADLKLGESAVIKDFTDDVISLKLLEMGYLPDTKIELCNIAPLGDPICIKTGNSQLSLRMAEASNILIQ